MISFIKHQTARTERIQGFTLIEVMVAVIILAIGILAIGSMQIAAIHSNTFAHATTDLKGWATDEYEGILSDPVNLTEIHPDLDAGAHQRQLPQGYTLNWQVTQDDILIGTSTIAMRIETTRFGVTKTVRFDYVMNLED